MTGIEIASGAVGQHGATVSTHGAEYEAAVHWLRQRGDGASTWGDDGLFGVVAATYAECTQYALAALTGLSGEIDGVGEGLMVASKRVRDTEDAEVENMGRTLWV